MNSDLPTQEPKLRRGGCLTPFISLLLTLLVVLAGVGFYAVRFVADKVIDAISVDSPRALPALTLTPEERQTAIDKASSFAKALETGQKGARLELRGQEVQAALEALDQAEWKLLKDKAFFHVQNELLHCEVSFPVKRVFFKEYPGRHINASLAIKTMKLQDGNIQITVDGAEIGRHKASKTVLAGKGVNLLELAHEAKGAPEPLQRFLNNVDTVEIAGGTLTIISR